MSELIVLDLEQRNELIQHYQNFYDLPGFVLLQSGDRSRGRYDILSACPYDSLRSHSLDGGFDALYARLDAKLHHRPSELDLPFQGGAIGYFSYDLAQALAQIPQTCQTSLKSMPLLELGFYDWAIIVDHQRKTISLLFANTQSDTLLLKNELLKRWYQAPQKAPSFTVTQDLKPLISREAYSKAFHAIHADIRRGRCYQVNYTQPFHMGYDGSTWGIYQTIIKKNPVPYAAFLKYDHSDILSFSPERFMSVEKGSLLASPIKGTKPRSPDPRLDLALQHALAACPKNRAENVMIVDLLRNDFGKIAKPGTVSVPSLFAIESYEAVHHLVSHVRAEAREGIGPVDAFLSCFPGGSITGTPKREAMHVIAEQEAFARGIYCGSIGYISNHGRLDMNISIRTITAREEILHLAAGGALVIGSDCDDEYQECFTKMAGILRGLS